MSTDAIQLLIALMVALGGGATLQVVITHWFASGDKRFDDSIARRKERADRVEMLESKLDELQTKFLECQQHLLELTEKVARVTDDLSRVRSRGGPILPSPMEDD
jgi:predicted nuclease with TOPRIM domain